MSKENIDKIIAEKVERAMKGAPDRPRDVVETKSKVEKVSIK